MTVPPHELANAAYRLYRYMLKEHWNGQAVVGPDHGIRFNARIGRFVKSYLNFVPWSDNYAYMQGQAYWILSNWLLADLLDAKYSREIALACANYITSIQQPEGYWNYPNPEWKRRIATVEGCFATLALLESYARVKHESFLASAKKWHQFLMDSIGFQNNNGMLAINYFANTPPSRGGVPNNSTLVLRTFARLAEITHDDQFLAPSAQMVAWLKHVQLKNGELPYLLGSLSEKDRPHFLCYQYNAFEFMDLVHYYRITGDKKIWPVLERLASYLSTGLTEAGAAYYDCSHQTPEVVYYSCALARALSQATDLKLGDFRTLAEQAYRRVLTQQRDDGRFKFFSRKNYGFLSDRRSYPRNLSMTLYQLLSEAQVRSSSRTAEMVTTSEGQQVNTRLSISSPGH
jgi:hypothetical protein